MYDVDNYFYPEELTGPTIKWDIRFLEVARLIATWSKDRSTKCGCVFVRDNRILSTGYNGFPAGTEDYETEAKHERPTKYMYFEHSERNGIYSAAKNGILLEGSIVYVTGPPCVDCTRALIQVGVVDIIIPKNHNFMKYADNKNQYAEAAAACMEMLKNADVGYWCVDVECPSID